MSVLRVASAKSSGHQRLAVGWLHAALPCAIAVPVLLGILATLGSIVTTPHPDLGFASTVASDAKSLALGQSLYADPSGHYSGMLYGPVYPMFLAPLYRLRWWDGWPPLITTLAGLVLALGAGLIAARPIDAARARRGVGVVGGVGLGGLAWWLLSANPRNALYEGRSDQLAWCLALSGLGLLAIGLTDPRHRVWPAVTLLTAATWTKQVTLGASVGALVAVGLWTLLGAVPAHVMRRFVAALVGSNVVVLGALMLVSRGWVWHFMVSVPARHSSDSAVGRYIGEMRTLIAPLLVLLCIPVMGLLGSSWWREAVAVRWRARSLSLALALGTALVLCLLFSIPPAWLARRKQGGDANNYIGVMWALAWLLALVHRECRRRVGLMLAGVVAYGLLVVPLAVPSLMGPMVRLGVSFPARFQIVHQPSLPADVVSYARSHEVYLPELGVLSLTRNRSQWPTQWNVNDLLAAGDTPGYLVDALVERRFDAVAHFDLTWEAYASGYGHRTSGYLSLLNAVIDRGYVSGANGAPPSLLGKRPGHLDLRWMKACLSSRRVSDGCRSLLASRP